jgi:transposase
MSQRMWPEKRLERSSVGQMRELMVMKRRESQMTPMREVVGMLCTRRRRRNGVIRRRDMRIEKRGRVIALAEG